MPLFNEPVDLPIPLGGGGGDLPIPLGGGGVGADVGSVGAAGFSAAPAGAEADGGSTGWMILYDPITGLERKRGRPRRSLAQWYIMQVAGVVAGASTAGAAAAIAAFAGPAAGWAVTQITNLMLAQIKNPLFQQGRALGSALQSLRPFAGKPAQSGSMSDLGDYDFTVHESGAWVTDPYEYAAEQLPIIDTPLGEVGWHLGEQAVAELETEILPYVPAIDAEITSFSAWWFGSAQPATASVQALGDPSFFHHAQQVVSDFVPQYRWWEY